MGVPINRASAGLYRFLNSGNRGAICSPILPLRTSREVSNEFLRWDILNLPGLAMIMVVRIKTGRQHVERRDLDTDEDPGSTGTTCGREFFPGILSIDGS